MLSHLSLCVNTGGAYLQREMSSLFHTREFEEHKKKEVIVVDCLIAMVVNELRSFQQAPFVR